MPTAADMPAIETVMDEHLAGMGHLCQLVGEPSMTVPVAAVANAVADAIACPHM